MSLRLNTTGQYLFFNTGLPADSVPMWLRFWLRVSVDTGTYQTILTDDNTDFYVGLNPTTPIFYDGNDRSSGQALSIGVWNHIDFVASGTSRRLYLNAVQVLDYTAGVSSDVPGAYYIGSTSGGSFTLNGALAAMTMYRGAPTMDDLRRQMRQFVPIRRNDLFAFWPFLDVASAPSDYSGNGHTLTVVGTLATEDNPPVPWDLGRPGYFLQQLGR